MRKRQNTVAAGPIHELLQAEIDASEHVAVATRIWPDDEDPERTLRRVLQQQNIHFDTADRILCKLAITWTSRPELLEMYEQVNLLAVDISSPTCLEAKKQMDALVLERYRENGNYQTVAYGLGVTAATVREILEALGELPVNVPTRICRNFHDTFEVGRDASGSCNECRRIAKEKKRAKRAALKAALA